MVQDIVHVMFSSMTADRIADTRQAVGADGLVSKPDIGRIREAAPGTWKGTD